MLEQPATFGQWLTGVVRLHNLDVDLPPRRRVKTWSERLAIAMKRGPEYDSYLRRVAKDERNATATTTYAIGCGLRAAKLAWCSGALALMRNPITFRESLAVIDIASRHEQSREMVMAWYLYVERARVDEAGYGPIEDEFSIRTLNLISALTDFVHPVLDAAFVEYQKRGLRKSNGFLGDAYLMLIDQRFARGYDISVLVLKSWLTEIRADSAALVSHAIGLANATDEAIRVRSSRAPGQDIRRDRDVRRKREER